MLIREIFLYEVWEYRPGSQERGQLWENIVNSVNKLHNPRFRVKPDFHSHFSPIADTFPFTLFAYRRRINLHCLRVPAKNCRNGKLVWNSIILVLRTYWGLSSLRLGLIKLWGSHFVKIFQSSWNVHVTQERSLIGFAVRKFRRSWNIWTSNANRAKDIFSSCSISLTTLRMSHEKTFADDQRKAWVKIRLHTKIS